MSPAINSTIAAAASCAEKLPDMGVGSSKSLTGTPSVRSRPRVNSELMSLESVSKRLNSVVKRFEAGMEFEETFDRHSDTFSAIFRSDRTCSNDSFLSWKTENLANASSPSRKGKLEARLAMVFKPQIAPNVVPFGLCSYLACRS